MSDDTGSLSVLNVGAGDLELRFNPLQPEEVQRAIGMLTEMIRRGYAILIREADGSYVRATDIDGTTGVYVIAGDPAPVTRTTGLDDGPALAAAPRKRGRPRKEHPIASSHAVSVGRTAGG